MTAHTVAMLFILGEHFGRRRSLPCGCRIGKSFANVKVTIVDGMRFRFRCRKCSNAGSALSMRRLRERAAQAVAS